MAKAKPLRRLFSQPAPISSRATYQEWAAPAAMRAKQDWRPTIELSSIQKKKNVSNRYGNRSQIGKYYCELANKRLGFLEEYTEGNSREDWIKKVS